MIKKTIRGLSLIAVFALLTAFLPLTGNGGFTAFAADGFVVEDGVLTEYNGPGGAVTIPTYVREIGSYAFSGNEDITCVTIPSSVTKIGNDAFNGCTGLTKVTMKDSVTRIDEYAFYHCTALTGIAIPSSVTFIGNGAFYECVALKNVSIPSSVKSIGYSIFSGCTGLTGVTLPNSVTMIPSCAFLGCTGLKSVQIPASVTKIDQWAFEDCTGLTSVSIANSVTTIGYGAFSGCIGLNDVTLPHSVTTIENYAFEGCKGLKSVTISNSVTNVGDFAFLECKGLTSLTIPASVTALGNGSFDQCAALKTVTILTKRASVNEKYSFSECDAVTDVYYAGTQSEWLASGFDKEFAYPVKIHYSYSLPSLTTQPKGKSIVLGDSLTLSVKATGSGLKYQWYFKKSGQTAWSVWNNRTHASEQVTPNATWDGIQLYCRVTDVAGKILKSNTVTIRVLAITSQPKSQTVSKGSSVTVAIKATGNGLKYQWYFKKKGQTAWSVWNGHTLASETATPNDSWNGIQLYCRVTDSAGHSISSDTATITLVSGPVITAQPKNQFIVLGSSATISVKASGSGLSYQWYYKKKGQTAWNVWNGRTHASETVTPNVTWDGIQLYCRVTDGAGNRVNSSVMSVSVLSISVQPVNQTVAAGNSITLSLKATGSGLSYQWYFRKKGQSAFSVWNGRTHASETVAPNATWNGIQLYCVVKDSAGHSVKSSTVTVTVR